MDIKAAIFDWDGTLIDSLMFWDVCWSMLGEVFLGSKDFRPTEEDAKRVRTVSMRDAMVIAHENYNMGRNADELLNRTNELIVEFYSGRAKLKSGVKEYLEHLYKNGVKMCIASATSPDMLKIAIKNNGLEKYFENIFSCDTIGVGKDRPDIYFHALKGLGADISDAWVFEDSVAAIETAVRAGFKVVGIYDKYNTAQDRIKEISTKYIGEGEDLTSLI